MTGLQLEQILSKKSLKKVEIAEQLGMSLQNFCAVFKTQDVKSGMLERIASAAGLSVAEFYGIEPCNIATGDGNTQVAGNGNTVNGNVEKLIDSLAKKDEQIDRLLSIIERLQEDRSESPIQ